MKIYKLRDLTLVSSNVAGSTYDEYDPATAYAIGNNVKVSFESDGVTPIFPVLEFESLDGPTTGVYPPNDAAKWEPLGAENKGKMFDDYLNTQTQNSDDIEVTLNANGADAIGFFGIYGTKVTLKLIRSAVTIKEETIDLRTLIPESGWYAWYFNQYEYGISQVIWEFPRYISGATLEITITARSGTAACGIMALGNVRSLAITQYGAKIGIADYSKKDTNDFGFTYLYQGEYADTADISMRLPNTQIDFVKCQLADIRGAPAIFDCNNPGISYQSFMIYGYGENFDIIVPGPIRSTCNLEIQGLI